MTKDYENDKDNYKDSNRGGMIEQGAYEPDEPKHVPWTPPGWSKQDLERGYQVPTLPPEKGLPSGLPEKDV
jgi:hypothetical protein